MTGERNEGMPFVSMFGYCPQLRFLRAKLRGGRRTELDLSALPNWSSEDEMSMVP